MNQRRALLAAMLAAPLAGTLAACSSKDELQGLNGADLSGADFGKDFSLMGTDGKRHALADFQGKAVLIFFGFTQCPDVCPTAMLRAVEARQKLGADGERVQVIFVTIDPERDTQEVLKEYVTAFDPSFLGLYGSADEIRSTAREYKVFYQKVPTAGSYTMDHSSFNYLYDAKGKLRVALRHTQTSDEYASDIRKVLAL